MNAQLPRARPLGPAAAPSIRWGAVGTGGIVTAFTRALHKHTPQRVVAVAARDRDRTAAFAAQWEIDRVHPSVEAIVADSGIDAVYIGTPHTSHAAIALRAISAGKHVLIEKPLAMTAAEGAEVAAAARAAGVLAMEAMWTRYLPQTDVIRQLLETEALGDIHFVSADFGYRVPFDAEHRLFNRALGGGALLDMGVYPISFASMVLGTPSHITASGALTSTGVDGRAALQLASPGGATAQVSTSIVSTLPTRATIIGSEGRVEVASPFFAPSGLTLTLGEGATETRDEWRDDAFENSHDGMSYQATAFAAYVAEGRTESPLHTLDETVAVLATIDEARRQIGA